MAENVTENENSELNEESQVPIKIQDKSLNFLIAQTVLCVLAIIFVLVLKTIGGEIFDYSKGVFDDKFNKPINMQQVLSAEETKKVLLAQSTVYGKGGTAESVKALKDKSVFSKTDTKKLSNTGINSMCIPVSGKITSEYAYRIHPISGEYLFHSGLDIGANMGDDIKSVLDGKVTEIDTDGETSYGKYIIVSHSSGTSTLYGHCSKIIAKKGQSVKKGDVIAKVGSTGNSTGPHLHFEVRVNGTRLNPRWFADFV